MQLIIITGQTATGKTKLAIDYAKKYNGELINCDSRQIYKHLDIITGKGLTKNSKYKLITKKFGHDIGYYNNLTIEQSNNKTIIWLYDIVDPKQSFSSYDWAQCALIVIKNILKRKKTPIIVGGTYLYLYHLLYQIDSENIPPNWQLRRSLANKTVSQLQSILRKINNQTFKQLNNSDLNNPHRLIRKIEILTANQTVQHNYFKHQFALDKKLNLPKTDVQLIGLKFKDKQQLRNAITQRINQRLKQGAVAEIETLLKQGYLPNDPGLKTIGCSEIIAYLNKKLSFSRAIDQWLHKELQYAKRQLTFMKKNPDIIWQ